jgi:hypothetical protein
MPEGDLGRQLGHCLVEDNHVVGHRVGPGVARAEQPREGITGAVGEAQQWMKSEATLVVGAGFLFVLRMDLNERRIDIEIDRTQPLGGRRSAPHLVTYLGDANGDGLSHLGGDLVEGPVQR